MKISDMRASLDIFEKYLGSDQKWWNAGAEHDIIFSELDIEKCPPDSEDGKLLMSYGWHADEFYWSLYT